MGRSTTGWVLGLPIPRLPHANFRVSEGVSAVLRAAFAGMRRWNGFGWDLRQDSVSVFGLVVGVVFAAVALPSSGALPFLYSSLSFGLVCLVCYCGEGLLFQHSYISSAFRSFLVLSQ